MGEEILKRQREQNMAVAPPTITADAIAAGVPAFNDKEMEAEIAALGPQTAQI
jgi:hypothetical protein